MGRLVRRGNIFLTASCSIFSPKKAKVEPFSESVVEMTFSCRPKRSNPQERLSMTRRQTKINTQWIFAQEEFFSDHLRDLKTPPTTQKPTTVFKREILHKFGPLWSFKRLGDIKRGRLPVWTLFDWKEPFEIGRFWRGSCVRSTFLNPGM